LDPQTLNYRSRGKGDKNTATDDFLAEILRRISNLTEQKSGEKTELGWNTDMICTVGPEKIRYELKSQELKLLYCSFL